MVYGIIQTSMYNLSYHGLSQDFFSTFDVDKLGKILWRHWNECPKISKVAKFENDVLRTNEGIAP